MKARLLAIIISIVTLPILACCDKSEETNRRLTAAEGRIDAALAAYPEAHEIPRRELAKQFTIQAQDYFADKSQQFFARLRHPDVSREQGQIYLTFSDLYNFFRLECSAEQVAQLLDENRRRYSTSMYLAVFEVSYVRRPQLQLAGEVDYHDFGEYSEVVFDGNDTLLIDGRLLALLSPFDESTQQPK